MSALLVSHATFVYGAEQADSLKSAIFRLDSETQIPEAILKPGVYSIRIADHLSDRMVIEIKDEQGMNTETFLGIPAKNVSNSSVKGPIIANGSKSSSALRGFSFSKSNVIEFIYPKEDAVALATLDGSPVLAMDPVSDGMVATAGLSTADMKIVTLWMLTPTSVGLDQLKPGIKATRYESHSPNSVNVGALKPPVLVSLPKPQAACHSLRSPESPHSY